MMVFMSDGSVPSVINESTSSLVYIQLISTCLPSSREMTNLSSSIFTDIPWSSNSNAVNAIGAIMCLIATKMLLSLQSTNEDYSTIRTNINIPWECKYVKYWLSSVNFNANICMCTSNDSIKLHRHNNVNDTDTITFEDETLLTENKLLDYLNLDGNNILVQFDVNDSGKIVMTPLSGDIVFDYIPQHTRMK